MMMIFIQLQLGVYPVAVVHDYRPKLHITTTVNTNNTYSKPFTLHWAEVRVRTVPRL